MQKIPPEHRPYVSLGILEAGLRIYDSALVVVTRNEEVKIDLKATYGGSIEPSRWVLRGHQRRIQLLEAWAKRTGYTESANRALTEANRLRAERTRDEVIDL